MAARCSCAVFVALLLLYISCSDFAAAAAARVDELAEQELDLIEFLPGQPPVSFRQYSGYVTVNKGHGRALFYWLTEASGDNADRKPLVLWLNGGPGCSSVAYGASEEIGPFRIRENGTGLYLNKFSWNKEANILFLESPAGVGFSYTNTSSDLKTSGDNRTAEDALQFLKGWMDRFPQYKGRDFYLSGESYAGHYVPQLAKKILDYNKNLQASEQHQINLKGFLVGNAVTDNYYDNVGAVTYWWTHAMISDRSYHAILASCNFTVAKTSNRCDEAVNYAMNHEFGPIDQYSIYTPYCNSSVDAGNGTGRGFRVGNSLLLRRRSHGYDPCVETHAEIYYNRRDVQRAMHANITGSIRYRWTACSDVLIKSWHDSEFSMLPTYRELIAAGLRIWVFSGDTDSVVPVTATRFSIGHLRLRTEIRWYPWYAGREVAGWSEAYEGLTFATVRGAGHEVPLFQPKRALQLFRSFLAGKPLPKSRLPS